MHVKRRRLPNFETCSVALFASLALYGPLPARAQTALPAAPRTAAAPEDKIPPNRWTAEQLTQAFKKGDDDGNGELSRKEATVWAGLSRRFDQIDSNKDGSISSAEFDEALK